MSYLFQYLANKRRLNLEAKQPALPVPLIVVGNITVGGTGKTPVVIALVKALAAQGIVAGVVTRGYRNNDKSIVDEPLIINADTPIEQSGDEARLIYEETLCPLALGQDRVAAAEWLLERFPAVQLIISDDGLQHYRLPRQLEIAVIDGDRGLGNGYCLPAGPLREPIKRLASVDWVLVNGGDKLFNSSSNLSAIETTSVQLQPLGWRNISTRERIPLNPLPWNSDQSVTAVAAIGNPQRFFTTIENLGIKANTLAFDDHHNFVAENFTDIQEDIIVMTTKDAVKCETLAKDNWWALEVSVVLPAPLLSAITALLGQ